MFNNTNLRPQESHTSSETSKITPKTPIFDERCSPIKFLEELKDFRAAIKKNQNFFFN